MLRNVAMYFLLIVHYLCTTQVKLSTAASLLHVPFCSDSEIYLGFIRCTSWVILRGMFQTEIATNAYSLEKENWIVGDCVNGVSRNYFIEKNFALCRAEKVNYCQIKKISQAKLRATTNLVLEYFTYVLVLCTS